MKKLSLLLIIIGCFNLFASRKAIPEWAKSYCVKYIKHKSERGVPVSYLYEKTELSKEGDSVIYSIKKIIKIQNLTGRLAFSTFSLPFNKNDRVLDALVWRIKGIGRVMEFYSKKDMAVLALSENFVDDSRQLVVNFDSLEEGDVIIVYYSVKKKDLFPHYFLSFAEDGDILESEIVINNAERVAVLNDKQGIVQKDNGSFRVFNLPYVKKRRFMPSEYDLYPLVAASFSKDLNSWDAIAKEYFKISNAALDLPPDKTIPLSNPSDKVKSIKEILKFVAEKINYVDIEIGNGRIIPKPCSFVFERKYGDCKDKTFLAINLLKNAGIEAFPVLAKGFDDGRVYPEFPGIQFNHVVVAVKLDKSTMRLKNAEIDGNPYLIFDITDRITNPPFIPSSLQGTYGLFVSANGGRLISFPVFSPLQNKVKVFSSCKMHLDNSVWFEINEEKTGLPAYSEKWFIEKLSEKNRTRKYTEFIQDYISGATLIDFEVENNEDTVKTQYSVRAEDYVIQTSEGILIIPFPFTSRFKNPFRKRTRKMDIVYSKKLTVERRAEWELPEGVKIIKLPEDTMLDNDYFFFERKVKQKDGKVVATAKYVRKKMIIPEKDYKSYRKFYKKYIKALKSPIVISK